MGAALGATALAVVLAFLASTWGLSAWSRSQEPRTTGTGALPLALENAPPAVGTTEEYGPLGPVSMVFAGTEVEDGLTGHVARPWLAIGSLTGDYRAIAAPGLPEARRGAVAVSPTGDRLAWATGDAVVVHDPVTGSSRDVPLAGAARIGRFSPDGTMVTVHAQGLRLLDLESAQLVAGADGTDPDVTYAAAWRADGSAVDLVDGARLVSLAADGSGATHQRSPFAEDALLAWAPSGDRVVAMQDDDAGVPRLVSAQIGADGRLGPARRVDTSGVGLVDLIGFSGDSTVAVSAYLLESGNLERILDVPLDGGSFADMTTLPPEGENWRGSPTLAVSEEALRAGSTDFGTQTWPWSHRARLVAWLVLGLFGLGMWVTRRRRPGRR